MQRPGAGFVFYPDIEVMVTVRQSANRQGAGKSEIIKRGGDGNRGGKSYTRIGVKKLFGQGDRRLDEEFPGLMK